jgi:hypothetical protein
VSARRIYGLRDMGRPDLSETPPTCKWTQWPYPQPRRPWNTTCDLIQISEDLPGLWRKFLL